MRLALSLIFIILSHSGLSQDQDWSSLKQRNTHYPDQLFFTGFMSMYLDRDEVEEYKHELIEQAKVQLSENIRVRIKSTVTHQLINANSISQDQFEKISSSYSSVELSGIQTDFSFNKKRKQAMAFSWIRKSKVAKHYREVVRQKTSDLERKLIEASAVHQDDRVQALKLFHEANVLILQVEEAQAILMMCGLSSNQDIGLERLRELRKLTKEGVEGLNDVSNLSLPELADYVIINLKHQLNEDKPIAVSGLTYKTSGVGSEFSKYLTNSLINKCHSYGLTTLQKNAIVKNGYLLKGSFWDNGNSEIEVMVSVVDEESRIVATASAWIHREELKKANLEFLPDDYEEAHQISEEINSAQVFTDGAKLELWTNHGSGNQVLKSGEEVRLTIRLNQVGYVRLVNYWSDGTVSLLIDNYYVDERKVNRKINLPIAWEVKCPCGVEFIQAVAQDVSFPFIEKKRENGINKIVSTNMGLIHPNLQNPDQASDKKFMIENRLVLTSVE